MYNVLQLYPVWCFIVHNFLVISSLLQNYSVFTGILTFKAFILFLLGYLNISLCAMEEVQHNLIYFHSDILFTNRKLCLCSVWPGGRSFNSDMLHVERARKVIWR